MGSSRLMELVCCLLLESWSGVSQVSRIIISLVQLSPIFARKTWTEIFWPWEDWAAEIPNHRAPASLLRYGQLWECKAEDDVSANNCYLLLYLNFPFLVILLPPSHGLLECGMTPTLRLYSCWTLSARFRNWSQTSTARSEHSLMLSTSFKDI